MRPLFPGSFGYFSQPYYWRADYGYRGDWVTERVELTLGQRYRGLTVEQAWECVYSQRNVVDEMVAHLRAVKPARAPLRELQTVPQLVLV